MDISKEHLRAQRDKHEVSGEPDWSANPILSDIPADDLEHALSSALNRFSAENTSNTPDWILAQYLLGCLKAWNDATQQRETWYGRSVPQIASVADAGSPTPKG